MTTEEEGLSVKEVKLIFTNVEGATVYSIETDVNGIYWSPLFDPLHHGDIIFIWNLKNVCFLT